MSKRKKYYSNEDKFDYYLNRVSDITLTKKQREYANKKAYNLSIEISKENKSYEDGYMDRHVFKVWNTKRMKTDKEYAKGVRDSENMISDHNKLSKKTIEELGNSGYFGFEKYATKKIKR